MFYVLFTYSKGQRERDFRGFRSEDELIDFLHLEYERIDIVQIISVEKSYRLGLIETPEVIKSVLIQTEKEATESLKKTLETDLPSPEEREALKIPDEAILEPGEKDDRSSKKHPYLKDRKEEPSAMEKIADDIEKEMTEEEIIKKNKKALKKADESIAAAKKDLAKSEKFIPKPAEKPEKKTQMGRIIDKTDWPMCPDCNRRKMAPWNDAGRCSHCQQYKKKPKKPKLDQADLIAAGKKSMEEEKKTWQTCPKCGIRKVAPWSTTGICSYCQGNRGKKKK